MQSQDSNPGRHGSRKDVHHIKVHKIIFISNYRYAYGKFSVTHEATIGGCFLTKDEELDDHVVKYEIWDTAGQERYHSLA